MSKIFVSIALLLSSSCFAQEFKPYPRANITEAQWQAYFDEVRAKHGANVQDIEQQKLVVYQEPISATSYAFTKQGHPAHPAWITRKVEQKPNGDVGVNQVGYFAGDEPAFAQLFKAYLQLNEQMRQSVKRKLQEGEPK